MPRGLRHPSEVFQQTLAVARNQLLANAQSATAYVHKGIRGDERAGALSAFLEPRLPGKFALGKGEAIDCFDSRTGQIDIAIYDQSQCTPLSVDRENLLLPCEALYCVIEVKSILTRAEVAHCLQAAEKVRSLRPFKGNFVGPQVNGLPARAEGSRCMYIVFGFETDLSAKDWPLREMKRLNEVAAELRVKSSVIERLLVLDRGMLNPCNQMAKSAPEAKEELFLEFYVHLMNFLAREGRRRPGLDLQHYVARTSKGWASCSPPPGEIQDSKAPEEASSLERG